MNEQRCQVPGCTFPTITVQNLHETWDQGEPLWINGIFAPLSDIEQVQNEKKLFTLR
jgi:hemolysin-activating ACP:hemolysin acyltransferase